MPPKTLSNPEKALLQTRLPKLHTMDAFATKHPSKSRFALHSDQILSWDSCVQDLRRTLKRCTQGQMVKNNHQLPVETHGVANELGVQSRLIEHVSQQMNRLFSSLDLGVRIADPQYGIYQGPPEANKKDENSGLDMIPDLVIVTDSNNNIKVVGEVKTWWTFQRLKDQSRVDFLAVKFGQLAAYMHRFNCRYGFFTTYEETWILQRQDRDHFLYSPAIKRDQNSSSNAVSVREAFLFLGIKASSPMDAFCISTTGMRLIVTRTKKPKRSAEVVVEDGRGNRKRIRRRTNDDSTPKRSLSEHRPS